MISVLNLIKIRRNLKYSTQTF